MIPVGENIPDFWDHKPWNDNPVHKLQLREGSVLSQTSVQAHAQAWHPCNRTWRNRQPGLVGISLNCNWREPVDTSNPKDIEAAKRYLQFCLGWFANPIYAGRESTEQGLAMSRLLVFSRQEKSYIKGTSDFLGLGHFTTWYITERNYPSRQGPSYQNDHDVVEIADPNWLDLGSKWFYSVPWGFRRLLNFAQTQYGDSPIYVTENGVSQKLHCNQLCDEWRIQYLKGYINEMLKGRFKKVFLNPIIPKVFQAAKNYSKTILLIKVGQYQVESWHFKTLETCSINNQKLAAEPLLSHMQTVPEIVVPTVCTLCVLITAGLLMLLLQGQSCARSPL